MGFEVGNCCLTLSWLTGRSPLCVWFESGLVPGALKCFVCAFGCLENNADGHVLKGHLTLRTVLSSTCNKIRSWKNNVNDFSVRVHAGVLISL